MLNKKVQKEKKVGLSFSELAAFAATPKGMLKKEPVVLTTERQIESMPVRSLEIPVPNRFQAVFTTVELGRFEVFEEYLAKNKIYRLSRNAILRTLLRLQTPGPEFLTTYQSVIEEDRRRVKGRNRGK